MQEVFVTGPLAWPPLLGIVAGGPLDGRLRAARLTRAALDLGADTCFPALVPAQDGVAVGVLVDLPDRRLFDRIEYVAAVLGATPVPKHIEVEGEARAAIAFLGEGEAGAGPAWDEARWAGRWGEMALTAAAEIVGYFGRKPAAEVAAHLQMLLARAASRVSAANAAPATLRSDTSASQVEVSSREATHEGFFLTHSYDLRHPAFDGHESPELRREVFVATDAAIVLPYDPVRDRLLLVEQFRMGPFGRGDPRPFVLEPVAGRVDAGETPETTARREAWEEAGLTLHALEHMTSHYCSPGCSTEFYHCYLGLTDLPDTGRGRGGLETENEDIRTHVLGFERAMELVESGEANVGPLVLMLLWLQRERPRLRSAA
ncbi:MAG: NUDIX domain-containing protein [Roseovarius sp.]|uniref:NUDIX domain-containing protein n=1 Tax=Alphaproteobacteria TaxID=28211 RepID=UPI0032ECB9AB